MLCWTGRRNEYKQCGSSKNHKHMLSILIIRLAPIIRSIVIYTSEFNSHTLSAELGIRYIN